MCRVQGCRVQGRRRLRAWGLEKASRLRRACFTPITRRHVGACLNEGDFWAPSTLFLRVFVYSTNGHTNTHKKNIQVEFINIHQNKIQQLGRSHHGLLRLALVALDVVTGNLYNSSGVFGDVMKVRKSIQISDIRHRL